MMEVLDHCTNLAAVGMYRRLLSQLGDERFRKAGGNSHPDPKLAAEGSWITLQTVG
jgi:hypothetical protein